ncbi:hypothetical protein [Marinifilum sp. D737]|uniref:hypothetical protein n=1 Tax=Marinifilum sp. D737 TaxID=2969628 RepID=UPI002272881E|nr:hypothetical protein [Marinifilum sp. D737]MCY1635711.1 hypothetical protein [Marinifilum sp. D737]
MNKINPWAFGIVFLSFVAFYAWNGFKLPIFFWGKTCKQDAVIYDTKIHTVSFGGQVNWKQTVRYFYQVDNGWYDGSYTLKGAQSKQRIGNLISLEVSKSRPAKHRVRAFYKSDRNIYNLERHFETRQISGYKKLNLANNVFSLIDFSVQEDSVSKYYGVLHVKNDSIKELIPIIHYYKSKTYLEYQLVDDDLRNQFHKKYQQLEFEKKDNSIRIDPLEEVFYQSYRNAYNE